MGAKRSAVLREAVIVGVAEAVLADGMLATSMSPLQFQPKMAQTALEGGRTIVALDEGPR